MAYLNAFEYAEFDAHVCLSCFRLERTYFDKPCQKKSEFVSLCYCKNLPGFSRRDLKALWQIWDILEGKNYHRV